MLVQDGNPSSFDTFIDDREKLFYIISRPTVSVVFGQQTEYSARFIIGRLIPSSSKRIINFPKLV